MKKGSANDLLEKKVSRRNFMKGCAFVGGVSLVTGMWPRPLKGETKQSIRITSDWPAAMTPGLWLGVGGQVLGTLFYDYLYRIDDRTKEMGPSLVEQDSVSKDLRVWEMKLRENVKFHDGSPFNVDSLQFTIDRLRKIGSAMIPLLEQIERLEKVDAYTVRFSLKRPNPDFPTIFMEYNIPMMSPNYDYDKKPFPMGTGPFKVTSYLAKERFVGQPNPHYWVPNLPIPDEIIFLNVPEMESRVTMLEAGDVDVVLNLGIEYVKRIEKKPELKLFPVERIARFPNFGMRCDMAPFNDERVREAMRYLVDRVEMREAGILGYGMLTNDHLVPPFYKYYHEYPIRQQNIEKAKQLLSESGYGKGFEVDLYTIGTDPYYLNRSIVLKEMAKKAGIRINLKTHTADVHYGKFYGEVPFIASSMSHRENPIDALKLFVITAGKWNRNRFSDPKLDELIQQVGSEPDSPSRKEHFKEIQEILMHKGPYIIPYTEPLFAATRKNIKDFYISRGLLSSGDFRYIKKEG